MNNIESLELKISKFLRVGVLLAAVFMFIGWMMQFKLTANPFFSFSIYDQIPFTDLLQHHLYRKNWGALISYLGLIILISLPVIRVALTGFLFLRQKEFILAGIAFLVLFGLVISFVFGFEH